MTVKLTVWKYLKKYWIEYTYIPSFTVSFALLVSSANVYFDGEGSRAIEFYTGSFRSKVQTLTFYIVTSIEMVQNKT